MDVVWTPDLPTDSSYTPFPGLTVALTLIQSVYIFLYFVMNA